MESHIQEIICCHYALGAATRCEALPGTRNRNYVLDTDTGPWFVRRRFSGYADPDRVAFDHEALLFLNAHNIPAFPPITNPTGKRSLREADALWEVYPYIQGHPLREGDLTEMRALGSCVARMHDVGRSFPHRLDKLGPRGETDPRVIRGQAGEIEREDPGITSALRRYRQWVEEAALVLADERFDALPHTLIHGDLQPANILMHEQRVAALVDFDWCAWRPRIYDLAFAILFSCATHDTPIDGSDIWSLTQTPHVDAALAEAFLDAYNAGGPPLSAEERAALPAQMVLSWCHSRVAGALKVARSDRGRFLARAPDTLEALVPPFLKT